MLLVIPDSARNALISAAQLVVTDVCRNQLGQMKQPPSREVDFIASLIENGAVRIETAWRTLLSPHGVDVRVAGLFCHQSPMVRITPTLRCELADLLLVHSHASAAGKEYWRAVLMQAKICAPGSIIAKPDEPQFRLYSQWPAFSIHSPGFDPRRRDFRADPRSGRYALVSNAGWFVSPPQKPLSAGPHNPDLSSFLVEMLYDMDPGQKGRTSSSGRQVYRWSKFDWSPTIRDLLRHTALKPLRHKGKVRGNYHNDLSRLGGSFFQFLTDVGSGDEPPPEVTDVAEGGGPNILVVRTSAQ